MRFCSKEYLTKNATPRNSANPPTHANSFTPRKLSHLIGGSVRTAPAGRGNAGGASGRGCGSVASPGRGSAGRTGGTPGLANTLATEGTGTKTGGTSSTTGVGFSASTWTGNGGGPVVAEGAADCRSRRKPSKSDSSSP